MQLQGKIVQPFRVEQGYARTSKKDISSSIPDNRQWQSLHKKGQDGIDNTSSSGQN